MNYILIYGTEDGLRIKTFTESDDLLKYLKDYWDDKPIKFLDYIDLEELYYDFKNKFIVIKGNIIEPKPITIVKTFEIE